MSRTHKVTRAWRAHHGMSNTFLSQMPDIAAYNAALRYGNDRKSHAKAKVVVRRKRRRQENNLRLLLV